MRKYFFAKEHQQKGPFSFMELKDEDINKETLIWYEGLEDWTLAAKLPELKTVLELKPPIIKKTDIENSVPPLQNIEISNFKN